MTNLAELVPDIKISVNQANISNCNIIPQVNFLDKIIDYPNWLVTFSIIGINTAKTNIPTNILIPPMPAFSTNNNNSSTSTTSNNNISNNINSI